jgi:hypothetical protein
MARVPFMLPTANSTFYGCTHHTHTHTNRDTQRQPVPPYTQGQKECVRVYGHAYVCMRMRTCVRVCMCVYVCMRVRTCALVCACVSAVREHGTLLVSQVAAAHGEAHAAHPITVDVGQERSGRVHVSLVVPHHPIDQRARVQLAKAAGHHRRHRGHVT